MPAHQHDDELDAVIRHVIDEDDRAVIHRGKYTVAVIPVEDLELLEAFEDARDMAVIERFHAEDDGQRFSWEEVKAELGM
ncbi:MAG: hypothetical protein ACRD0K_00575 [Egibacteraceae bacterium]